MGQACDRLGLGQEALPQTLVRNGPGQEHFEGDVAVEVPLAGAPYHPHAPPPEFLLEPEATEHRPRTQRGQGRTPGPAPRRGGRRRGRRRTAPRRGGRRRGRHPAAPYGPHPVAARGRFPAARQGLRLGEEPARQLGRELGPTRHEHGEAFAAGARGLTRAVVGELLAREASRDRQLHEQGIDVGHSPQATKPLRPPPRAHALDAVASREGCRPSRRLPRAGPGIESTPRHSGAAARRPHQERTLRIGLLGGSFNPPHRGHLAVARAVRAALDLDEVWLLPAPRPPHKPGRRDMASPRDRLAMVRLATQGEPGLVASDLELRRPGPSYTIDTVRTLAAERPGDCFYWVIGADTIDELPTWKEAAALLEAVTFVAVDRPGHDVEEGLRALAEGLGAEAAQRLREHLLRVDPPDVSSTEVRRRVLAGEPWEHLVPPRVAEFIRAEGLYGRNFVTRIATVRALEDFVDQRVELRGWLYKFRGKGKIAFLHLRDGTGVVQCVAKRDEVGAEALRRVKEAGQESALILRGTVRADERAPGGYEVVADDLELVAPATEEYPIALQDHGIDFLLSKRHLWLRSRKQHAVLRIRSEVCQGIRDFFYARDFVLTDAPIFTPSACEGTTNLFEVNYFDDKAYLTQSGQLYMEATAMAHGKVYCFGPTFRAERSKTRRHLTEFWMCEPEMAYATLDDAMDLAEELLEYLVGRALERCGRELAVLERDLEPLERVRRPFPRITYDEAAALLAEKGHEFRYGDDFGAPDETAISEHFDRPVLIHRYPAAVKAFYMKRDPAAPDKALCVDVIAPEGVGEVIGGGERATDLAYLEEQIAAHRLPKEAFEWYLDLRRFGSVPHAGFGLGLERTVAWIAGREHVREAIPFPRTLYRKEP
ncbi:MAG: asparagine--tRNA ligase [Planctomycetota bacterium]|nr:MAG: asparagine--tRNA ligase [Planctomycetota bacterium]